MFGLYNFDPNRRKSNRTIMAKTATFKLYGNIGEPMVDLFFGLVDDGSVSANMVDEFIQANQDADEFVIRVNSNGGDVQEGWTIYDLLTTSGKKITTVGEGKIYSIATVVFLAGSTRKILKNADGLIHNPYIPPYTLADAYESAELAKLAESLAQEEQKILEFYVEKTGQPTEKLAEYMKNETKLSADDMLSMGFATEIIEPVRAFAYIKPIKNNQMATETEKTKIMERFDALMAGDFAKAFSRVNTEPKNLSLTDTSGNTLTVEKESGEPAVGDTASPDGTFVMENGDSITVTDGKIASITPAEKTNPDLDAANAEIERLKSELETLKNEKTTAETALADFKAKEIEITNMVTELRAIKNAWKPAARQSADGGKTVVDGVDMTRAQEILNKHKIKNN